MPLGMAQATVTSTFLNFPICEVPQILLSLSAHWQGKLKCKLSTLYTAFCHCSSFGHNKMLWISPFDSKTNVSQWVRTANCREPTWQMRIVHPWASVLQDHHQFEFTPINCAAATRKSCCFSLLRRQPHCLPRERTSPCSVGADSPPALSFSCSTRAEGQPGGLFVPTCITSHQSWAHRLCICKQASAHTDNDFQSGILLLSGRSFWKTTPTFLITLLQFQSHLGDAQGCYVNDLRHFTWIKRSYLCCPYPALLRWWKQPSWKKYQTCIYRGLNRLLLWDHQMQISHPKIFVNPTFPLGK